MESRICAPLNGGTHPTLFSDLAFYPRMPRSQKPISISFNSLESAEATRDRFRSSGYTELTVVKIGNQWVTTGIPPLKFENRANQYTSKVKEEDDWSL